MKKILKDNSVKKILFITLSNIGDVILTVPTLESLHKKFGKNSTNVENILKNMYNSKLIYNLENMSNIKFVNWIIG